MKKGWMVLICFFLLGCAGQISSGRLKSSVTETPDGKRVVVLENNLYRLSFKPSLGGRCTSFIVKKTGNELVYESVSPGAGYPGAEGGFFLDYFREESAPGEFIGAAYDYEILKGKGKATIRLWRVATGKTKDREFPEVAGIRLEKAITLYSDSPAVDVDISLTNRGQKTKSASYWAQAGFQLGGQKENDVYYRPSTRHIQVMEMNPSVTGVVPEEWVRDPVEGWSAARDSKTNEGIVFLMDYNYLSTLFNGKACTADWFMDRVVLPPGATWRTRYTVIPVDGFKGFVHASNRLIADIEVSEEKGTLEITHFVAGARKSLGDVTLRTSIYDVRSKKRMNLPAVKLKGVGLEPKKLTINAGKAQTEPIVVRVEASSGNWSESYENYFWGDSAPFVLPGYPVPPEHTRKRPRKVKTYINPVSWNFPENNKTDVLLFFGLYTQWYGLEEAITALGPHSLKVSNARVGIHYQGADYIPASYDETMNYDLVILSDADVKSLKYFGTDMLPEYVRQGGGLLMLGGPFAYGEGDYSGTEIEEVLPVEGMHGFDLKWEKEGLLLQAAAEHAILAGVDFSGRPRVYWYHDLRRKPEAKVVVKAGDKPILVVGRCGKGKVAAFLGSPLGLPQQGQRPFWEWPGWEKLMQNVIRWLAERED